MIDAKPASINAARGRSFAQVVLLTTEGSRPVRGEPGGRSMT
jgi:hypothetical protein